MRTGGKKREPGVEAGGGVDTDGEEAREKGGIMGECEGERMGSRKAERKEEQKKKRNNESFWRMCSSCISPACRSF